MLRAAGCLVGWVSATESTSGGAGVRPLFLVLGSDGQGGGERGIDTAGDHDYDTAAVELVAHDGAHALADPVRLRFAVEIDDLLLVPFCQGYHWLCSARVLAIRSKTCGVLQRICEAFG